MTSLSEEELRSKIRQELLTSGKYEEIFNFLKIQLVNSGWFEQFKNKADEVARSEEDLSFAKVLKQVEASGVGSSSVPDSVKAATLAKIKEFLDTVVE